MGASLTFRLTGSVGYHDSPIGLEAVQRCLHSFGYRSNLVDLEQQSIACLGLDGLLDVYGIRHSQVVANDLALRGLEEVAPGFPVILKLIVSLLCALLIFCC